MKFFSVLVFALVCTYAVSAQITSDVSDGSALENSIPDASIPESPDAGSSIAESVVQDESVSDNSAVDNTFVDAPIAEAPDAGSSIPDEPVADSPAAVENSIVDTPIAETVNSESSIVESAAQEEPVPESSGSVADVAAEEQSAPEGPIAEGPSVESAPESVSGEVSGPSSSEGESRPVEDTGSANNGVKTPEEFKKEQELDFEQHKQDLESKLQKQIDQRQGSTDYYVQSLMQMINQNKAVIDQQIAWYESRTYPGSDETEAAKLKERDQQEIQTIKDQEQAYEDQIKVLIAEYKKQTDLWLQQQRTAIAQNLKSFQATQAYQLQQYTQEYNKNSAQQETAF